MTAFIPNWKIPDDKTYLYMQLLHTNAVFLSEPLSSAVDRTICYFAVVTISADGH